MSEEKKVVLPHPCDGEQYALWDSVQYMLKAGEEFGEMQEALADWRADPSPQNFGHLMRECTDVIVAVTGFMDSMGADERERQAYLEEVNESNSKRDGGRRFRHD